MITRKEIAAAAVTAAVLIGGVALISGVDSAQHTAQTQFVYDAVQNAALTCYAVEGAYPADLAYLRENYGLAYDTERYRVTYSTFASNLVPEIYVVEVGAKKASEIRK
ncbi:MAG: hypothetical protein J6E44_11350 [Lachnospiraceae bacterium]|nr:hypothetical protein [Lachnospiraceae bacterium]